MGFVAPVGTRLLRQIGCGSTFAVALVAASNAAEARELVCKRVAPRAASVTVALRALEREASLLERLRHPALPEWLGAGEDEHGPFLLQSRARGQSLRAPVDASPASLRQPTVLAAFTALAELHAWQEDGVPLGFSHGDLCPDHVLIDGAGVTFIDLGQARYASLDTTDLGAERGTLPYVAPELARGDVAPDPTNDVYALAACFAHVLLGRDPCRHPHGAARLVEIADEGVDRAAIQAASQAPRTVIETLLAALHPERSRRLQRAADVADSLRGG